MSESPARLIKNQYVEDTETSLLVGCDNYIHIKHLAQHLEYSVFCVYKIIFAFTVPSIYTHRM